MTEQEFFDHLIMSDGITDILPMGDGRYCAIKPLILSAGIAIHRRGGGALMAIPRARQSHGENFPMTTSMIAL